MIDKINLEVISMKFQLTKREQQIMEILWNSDEPLSSNDILQKAENLSIHTIQQVLRKLNEDGYIKVDGVGFTKNSITRKYAPSVSQANFLKQFIGRNTEYELVASFIQENNDPDVLDELERLIKESRNKLK